jgi:hypothetical protein
MIDFVAVSYVRCAADIAAARAALAGAGLSCAGVAAEINTAAALGRCARRPRLDCCWRPTFFKDREAVVGLSSSVT